MTLFLVQPALGFITSIFLQREITIRRGINQVRSDTKPGPNMFICEH